MNNPRDLYVIDRKGNYDAVIDYIYIVMGSLIFAASVNFIIAPIGLYNGGFTGIAQLIRAFMIMGLGVKMPAWIDFTGIFNLLLNIPLLIYSNKIVGKKFTFNNIVSITLSSIFLAFIPVATNPKIDDFLTACIVGGVIGGIGTGMMLRGGGSSGGADIIAMCRIKTNTDASVGRLNTYINFIVYGICLFAFDVQVAVYSFIYAAIKAVFIDKMHTQNINVQVIIITKVDGVDKAINKVLGRGVTAWNGKGSYTDEDVHILISAISKYEISQLKNIVLKTDPSAFMIYTEGEGISGNFKRHLTKDFIE
ncbi:YitT family protein [Alterileibacterium massiliense]|uniref:YitT family protein n=1 Tax=Alterileibacterium massiliense TaxID=1870997 RepID=UPI0009F4CA39|nr:YitT family protein [Alterileibacterium massiliense]